MISGGQTGVDRAALDAALAAGIPVGGWCPEGRKAEDGIIPGKYPVKELPGGDYRERTRQNVLGSDGTVIIHFGTLSGGTRETKLFCEDAKKPYLLIDASTMPVDQAAAEMTAFVGKSGIVVLNVAGPRASKEPRAYEYTYATLAAFLRNEGPGR